MYTKQEASVLRQEFWTTFGHYMSPLPSSEGLKINWINYKTGLPHVTFKMDADNHCATIGIVLSHPDEGIRQLYFEQFAELKKLLHEELGEEWLWEPDTAWEYGKRVGRIYTKLDHVNVFKQEDRPRLISFFKSRIMALDRFWENARYIFESLR